MDCAHVVVNVEAWMTPRPSRAHLRVLEVRTTERLLNALDLEHGIDVDATLTELSPLVGGVRADPLLGGALHDLADIDRLDALAAEIGMTPARLRGEVRSQIGVPLGQLRMWSRLVIAIAWLPQVSTALAGTLAGFADQPHFTRACRRMLGRTPGDLRFGVCAAQSRRAALLGAPARRAP
jgi:AraC-like DNA-binding protein